MPQALKKPMKNWQTHRPVRRNHATQSPEPNKVRALFYLKEMCQFVDLRRLGNNRGVVNTTVTNFQRKIMPRKPLGEKPMTSTQRAANLDTKLRDAGGARKAFRLDKAAVEKLEALATSSSMTETEVVTRLLKTATKRSLGSA
ncbi:MAG: hypothetical protein ING75_16235 [Rhodocyclaceae bacterium]|nr:hypothetical protein [Rhodocyclaceae bacterium]